MIYHNHNHNHWYSYAWLLLKENTFLGMKAALFIYRCINLRYLRHHLCRKEICMEQNRLVENINICNSVLSRVRFVVKSSRCQYAEMLDKS